MKAAALNFRGSVILIADPSPFLCQLTHGMLRGSGATKVMTARTSVGVIQVLKDQKIDLLLCDSALPPHSGLQLTQAIRRNPHNPNRTVPILIMTGEARESTVKMARDAGANMVIAKPISPSLLFDRLNWIASHARSFIDTPTYVGPDRRFKTEGSPTGIGRRASDHAIEIAEESGPELAPDDIDSLSNAAEIG
jgi:two-component system, chemotaxis family, chemotaxis protein CheY